MIKRILTAGLLIGITASGAHAANCAMRDQVVDRLKSKYSEQLTAGGLQTSRSSQQVVEVWSSPSTGTFTVLLTSPHGLSCIVASGTDWHSQMKVAVDNSSAS